MLRILSLDFDGVVYPSPRHFPRRELPIFAWLKHLELLLAPNPDVGLLVQPLGARSPVSKRSRTCFILSKVGSLVSRLQVARTCNFGLAATTSAGRQSSGYRR
jgi:hypothetical protein